MQRAPMLELQKCKIAPQGSPNLYEFRDSMDIHRRPGRRVGVEGVSEGFFVCDDLGVAIIKKFLRF